MREFRIGRVVNIIRLCERSEAISGVLCPNHSKAPGITTLISFARDDEWEAIATPKAFATPRKDTWEV